MNKQTLNHCGTQALLVANVFYERILMAIKVYKLQKLKFVLNNNQKTQASLGITVEFKAHVTPLVLASKFIKRTK